MPYIHGTIYPEFESTVFPSRSLTILIDATAVDLISRTWLLGFDALNVYLRAADDTGWRVNLLACGDAEHVSRAFAGLTQQVRVADPPEPRHVSRVAEILGEAATRHPRFAEVVSLGLAAKVDFVLVADVPAEIDAKAVGRTLLLTVGEWEAAKREVEIFVRGHDIPWSFSHPAWWQPWNGFYFLTERPHNLVDLWQLTHEYRLDFMTQELTRSFALNRHPAIAFTRDRLLFYAQQERFTRRVGAKRQDFAFESSYYLNHWYLLLWAGLDQLCWIVNGVFAFGMTPRDYRRLGVLNDRFVALLKDRAPAVASIFSEPRLVIWAKTIRSARHDAAHRSVSQASQLYIRSDEEPSDAELDREIESTTEWKEIAALFPPEVSEGFRQQFRMRRRLLRYEEAPERVLRVTVDGATGLIAPLLNIQYDFDAFFKFASQVTHQCSAYLTERGSVARKL